jgi:hypothetical protein
MLRQYCRGGRLRGAACMTGALLTLAGLGLGNAMAAWSGFPLLMRTGGTRVVGGCDGAALPDRRTDSEGYCQRPDSAYVLAIFHRVPPG